MGFAKDGHDYYSTRVLIIVIRPSVQHLLDTDLLACGQEVPSDVLIPPEFIVFANLLESQR